MTLYTYLKETSDLYQKFSKTVRKAAFASGSSYEIVDVDGFQVPIIKGTDAYYTTISGKTLIQHPNSYNWPKTRHNSTKYIEVGRGWLIENGIV